MKKYLSFFKLRLNIALQYRAAAIGGMFTQFFWAIMQILIFQAFYKATTSNNISLEQLRTLQSRGEKSLSLELMK